MLLPTDTLYPSETLYPDDRPVIFDILKAFRDALVADETLLTLIPASSIYAGQRDEKTNIPAVDVFRVALSTEKLAGAKVGGITSITDIFQISTFSKTEIDALTIAGKIMEILLGDNTILNTAGIKNITQTNIQSLLEDNGFSHIPITISCNYMNTT